MAIPETDSEMIDQVIEGHHQISLDEDNPQDELRQRIERNLIKETNNLLNFRDWTFRYIDGTVPIAANSFEGNLPATWANEGRDGGVWFRTQEQRVVWKRLGFLKDQIERNQTQRGDPYWYTVQGSKILVYPAPSAAITLNVFFHTDGAVVADDGGVGITIIPARWRLPVLYEMVVAAEMKDKGEVDSLSIQRVTVQDNRYNMICEERQGQPEDRLVPYYPGMPLE